MKIIKEIYTNIRKFVLLFILEHFYKDYSVVYNITNKSGVISNDNKKVIFLNYSSIENKIGVKINI